MGVEVSSSISRCSLSLQLFDSWRARLRQSRCTFPCSAESAASACAGTCEGPAPNLCSPRGGSGPFMCTGGVEYTAGNGRGGLYSACDNGATTYISQAYRWALSVSDFSSSDVRGEVCARRLRETPSSFGLVMVPPEHVASMVESAAQIPHGPRRGSRASEVAVVINQFAHVHTLAIRLAECYGAEAGIGGGRSP